MMNFTNARNLTPVFALAVGVVLSFVFIAFSVDGSATIPVWCAAYGGCP